MLPVSGGSLRPSESRFISTVTFNGETYETLTVMPSTVLNSAVPSGSISIFVTFGLASLAIRDIHLRKRAESGAQLQNPTKVLPPATAAVAVPAPKEQRPTVVLSDYCSAVGVSGVLPQPRAQNAVFALRLFVAYLRQNLNASAL